MYFIIFKMFVKFSSVKSIKKLSNELKSSVSHLVADDRQMESMIVPASLL